jgi:site-specific DNA recombinase
LACAIYTRKSTSEGLDQEFNSLDAQREAGEAYVASQRSEGWELVADHYDDGGYSGGDTERPALRRLMADIEAGKIQCVIVYKVDRLSRSLRDFLGLMEILERHGVMFVSVTQAFNTASSMGRLMLNVLLSFAQFEREMVSERTRDKMAAARRKGHWLGGTPVLGYDVIETRLVVNEQESERVRQIFDLYLKLGGLLPVIQELARRGWTNKLSTTKDGRRRGGNPFTKGSLHRLLSNVTYLGKIEYQNEIHEGKHQAIIEADVWARAHAQLALNGRQGGAAARNKFGALLKGLLFCATCGCAMSPSHSTKSATKRYRYYRCHRSEQRGRGTCPFPAVPAEQIEQLVIDRIRGIGREPEVLAATLQELRQQTESEVASLTAEQLQLQRGIAKWDADSRTLLSHVSPERSDSSALARLADLQDRIRTGQSRLSEVDQQLDFARRTRSDDQLATRALADFDPVWNALSPRERTQLIGLLVEKVIFDGAAGKVSITLNPVSADSASRSQPENAA